MRISGRRRSRVGGRRLDLTALREVTKDDRAPGGISLGIVVRDGASHFEIDEGEDVLVDVELQPSRRQLTCRLLSIGGGADRGIWAIPPVGSEVLVAIREGEFEAGGVIVGTLSTGQPPGELADDQILVIRREKVTIVAMSGDVIVQAGPGKNVLLHDGSGAVPLVKLSEFNDHVHTGVTTGSGSTAVPAVEATGTTVLRAK